MKGYNRWNYHPYTPLDWPEETFYICRLAPGEDSFCGEWTGPKKATLRFGVCETTQHSAQTVTDNKFLIGGLEPETEYWFYLEDSAGNKSRIRRVRTGAVPGTVVNYLHPKDSYYSFSGSYLCSPSLVRLPSGALLASMDLFGHGAPQNLTLLFRSEDDGATWQYVTDLFPCFWGKLFLHEGKLYMAANSREYGDFLIGCSFDEGRTWSEPAVLARGSCCQKARWPAQSAQRRFKGARPLVDCCRLWQLDDRPLFKRTVLRCSKRRFHGCLQLEPYRLLAA